MRSRLARIIIVASSAKFTSSQLQTRVVPRSRGRRRGVGSSVKPQPRGQDISQFKLVPWLRILSVIAPDARDSGTNLIWMSGLRGLHPAELIELVWKGKPDFEKPSNPLVACSFVHNVSVFSILVVNSLLLCKVRSIPQWSMIVLSVHRRRGCEERKTFRFLGFTEGLS
jgi:hypothetical protein